MIDSLLRAIRRGKPWIDRFTRYGYREAFQEYRTEYEELFRLALQSVEPSELAEKLVEAIEKEWKAEHFWNRAKARVDDKMVIVSYLTPMLLGSREERCGALAVELCRVWNERFPKDPYCMADYDRLMNGFRRSILGIDLEHKHIHEREDE